MSDLKPCDCSDPYYECDERAGCKLGRAQPAITSETGNQAAQGASAITSGVLHQALTDLENQPNQYGVEFLMRGPKFAFRVGNQQFTLDYEPTETGEFEFMRDMLIHAFSTFTPDVKTAQSVPLLTGEQIQTAWVEHGLDDCAVEDFARAIEKLVRSKLGAGVGWIACTDQMPKPGRVVLACYTNELGNVRRIRAQWVAAKTSESSGEAEYGEYDEATDTYYDPEGWYECIDNWDEYSSVFVVPKITHWMPLPPPPGIVGKEGA